MAEVAISIANAVKYIAISVSVVALVGLAYAVMNGVYPFVPYLASAHLGGISYLVFKNINPITGAGFAAATIAFTFPMFQALVEPRETKGTPIDPYEFANALKGSAEVIVGGIAGGLTYAIGGQNLFLGVVGAGLGAFLGGRYFWNPLVNVFAGLKLIDGLQECHPASRKAAAVAWLAKKKEQCAQPGWPAYCAAYVKWMSGCPYAAPNNAPLPPSTQGPPASPDCAKYGTYQAPGEPYLFQEYIDSNQAVQIYPHMYNCDTKFDDTPLIPVQQGDWDWFADHKPSPVTMVTAGVFVCTETYSIPEDSNKILTPNIDGVPLNVTGSMAPGVYLVQGGDCSGYYMWNIQGPMPTQGAQLNYDRFSINSIGNSSQDPVLDAWKTRGKDFCAPANLPNANGITTPLLTNLQPLAGDRSGEFQIPSSADLTYSIAAKRDAFAPIMAGDTASGVAYTWASAPGVFDQPSPAGLPFPK